MVIEIIYYIFWETRCILLLGFLSPVLNIRCQIYCVRATKLVCAQTKLDMEDGYPSIVAVKVARRAILGIVGVNVVLGSFCAAPMQDMKEPDVLRTLKLPSGVIIQDIVEGKGQEAVEEDTVQFNYVCRRPNGYFVHSTVNQFSGESSLVILRLGDEQVCILDTFVEEKKALYIGNVVSHVILIYLWKSPMIKGLKEVLSGMKENDEL
ncbi:peptidyl-prolyl cis-trans isomerase FKBP16-1, chloroplastic-like isoform X3 [Salvia splendens]|uniref:peptidyl-prolyl cis-trans isomerase FKBP16-1, chloroplastic-like isoform X3 n=1 Tax=Salvia splendens TaxID=180675 RepID=UPI001C2630D0|nr:peptidyl-prolyl cis-trans isomerase FKBP16-1, chloroplastic-like isoform X3 [Salvia splendens]